MNKLKENLKITVGLCIIGVLIVMVYVSVLISLNDEKIADENMNQETKKVATVAILDDTINTNEQDKIETCATLEIPRIGIKQSILSEMTDEALNKSLCKLWGPNANDIGNFVIAGEMSGNDEIGNIAIGDKMLFNDNMNNEKTYEVYDIYNAGNDWIDTTKQETKEREITLLMKTEDTDNKLVIKAKAV